MATLYDKNGNEAHFPDEEVEARLAERWLIHRREVPRWFAENPKPRVPEQRLLDKRLAVTGLLERNAERRVAKGLLEPGQVREYVQQQRALTKERLLRSSDEGQRKIGGAL